MLLAPRAEAVTRATPVAPGLQVVKATSQCPAQATPLGAIVRIEVSLDEKLMAVVRVVPEAVCADAVKTTTPPRTREVLVAGARLIFPGNSGGPGLEPPPHPLRLHRERIASANH